MRLLPSPVQLIQLGYFCPRQRILPHRIYHTQHPSRQTIPGERIDDPNHEVIPSSQGPIFISLDSIDLFPSSFCFLYRVWPNPRRSFSLKRQRPHHRPLIPFLAIQHRPAGLENFFTPQSFSIRTQRCHSWAVRPNSGDLPNDLHEMRLS